MYEMDGVRKGPADLGVELGEEEDMLSEKALEVLRKWIAREDEGNLNFSLMALCVDE